MFVPLTDKSRVYIVAPAALATGGPELLHQLAHKLQNRGINVSMFYLPTNHPAPIHEAYLRYGVGYARSIEDKQENLLVVPETMTDFLLNYQQIRRSVWWLSIDNYFVEQDTRYGKFNRWLLSKWGSQRYLGFNRELKRIDYHFYQSEYAKRTLEKLGIENLGSLSDYLSQEFLSIETDLSKKQNLVAYNPKKGRRFTKKIIKKSPDIEFVPIANMNRDEVIALLQRAKVYIDFGHHPGKDRIPREASMLGCCVITSRKGSAKFSKDVPIGNDYKFRDSITSISAIAHKIRQCFEQFAERHKDFDRYRAIVRSQETVFDQEVLNVFRMEQ